MENCFTAYGTEGAGCFCAVGRKRNSLSVSEFFTQSTCRAEVNTLSAGDTVRCFKRLFKGRHNYCVKATAYKTESSSAHYLVTDSYAKTAEDITFDGGNPMMLFLDSGNGSKLNWEGYDFAIEITSENKAVLKAADGLGEWKWREIGDCEIKCEGNEIMISVSRAAINSPEYYGRQLVDLRFKWTDNCNDPETGTLSISDFYKNGDAAPMGRLNYVFSEAPAVTENE